MYMLNRLTVALLLSCAVGCATYEEMPLVPADILAEIERTRDLGAEPSGVEVPADATDFVRLAGWMFRYGPTLWKARAEFSQARGLADTETPWPNPSFAAGPILGYDLEPPLDEEIVPFVEFGFTIPLSGRLGLQDEVNELKAQVAKTRLLTEQRRAYLELRRRFAHHLFTRRRHRVQASTVASARASAALTRRLVEAGGATALDVGLMELEIAEQERDLLAIKGRTAEIRTGLATLVGVHDRHLGELSDGGPPHVEDLPDLEAAKETLVAKHPALAVLSARYAVAEQELRLEVRKQYPDLQLGTSYEGDPGTDTKLIGLTLGIALPLFDRNQQNIVVAERAREMVRTEYEATLSEALAALEGAYAAHQLALERLRLLKEVALPRAEANLDIAVRSIRAGNLDALKYLEVERRLHSLRLEAVLAEEACQQLISQIEQLLGQPLARFPGEPDLEFPFTQEEGLQS